MLGFKHPDSLLLQTEPIIQTEGVAGAWKEMMTAFEGQRGSNDMTVAGLIVFVLAYGLISGSFFALTFPLFASHAKGVNDLGFVSTLTLFFDVHFC